MRANPAGAHSGRLLEIDQLSVSFGNGPDAVHAVRGVDLHIDAGESLAIIGESGSGKTAASMSVLGLNPPPPVSTVSGQIRFDGVDLLGLDNKRMREVRGDQIAMVFQDPSSALNPLLTIGRQVTDAIRAHQRLSASEAAKRAVESLAMAQLSNPMERMGQYPHQLSGGMRQRAAIALAIAARPKLLIADEPTTALDAEVQSEILAMLNSLRESTGMALILVSHDLGVVAQHADRVAVMYAGRVVECGPSTQVLGHPKMPYTAALLNSTPRLDSPARKRLVAIEGQPPDPRRPEPGCPFAPRCPHAQDRCLTVVPSPRPAGTGHTAACVRIDELDLRKDVAIETTASAEVSATVDIEPKRPVPLVEFDNTELHYPIRTSILRRVTGQVKAVDGVSLKLWPGETLALVGESGSGKTSLSRTLLRLETPTGGVVRYDGIDVAQAKHEDLGVLQREVQVVFQNPYSSLDPRYSIRSILAEPLKTHGEDTSDDVLVPLLASVGIGRQALDLHPRAFSGGQRQRIAVARALALRPRLIVCDEAVSALDVSIQAQVLNLLADLQASTGIAYLFITHDLAVVRSVAHRIAVMKNGHVVEQGRAEQIYHAPQHEYTKTLLAAAPRHPDAENDPLPRQDQYQPERPAS